MKHHYRRIGLCQSPVSVCLPTCLSDHLYLALFYAAYIFFYSCVLSLPLCVSACTCEWERERKKERKRCNHSSCCSKQSTSVKSSHCQKALPDTRSLSSISCRHLHRWSRPGKIASTTKGRVFTWTSCTASTLSTFSLFQDFYFLHRAWDDDRAIITSNHPPFTSSIPLVRHTSLSPLFF